MPIPVHPFDAGEPLTVGIQNVDSGLVGLVPAVKPNVAFVADLEQAQLRRKELEQVIAQRCGVSEEAVLLSSMPGVSYSTAVSLACRVGRVERFPRDHSLANYWGLTPGCRNSGANNQRLGSITKAGSSMARWLLAQVTIKVLRKDARLREWFKRLKRRGASIARVA